jgi:PEP-CTERM motif-containing protein
MKRFALALLFTISVSAAKADIIYDTINPATVFPVFSSYPINNTDFESQSIAMGFTATSDLTVTSILAYISLNFGDSIELGIMGDDGGKPSGTFLYQATVVPGNVTPVSLANLSWTLSGSATYWLAAVAAPHTYANWALNFAIPDNLVGVNQTPGATGPWGAGLDDPAQVRIEGTFAVAPVPEPSTWAMMILGFCGIGYMTYRRRNTQLRVA